MPPETQSPRRKLIIWYKDLAIEDVLRVGGKNASLGEMIQNLTPLGVSVPDGFAVTADAYNYFLDESGIRARINKLLTGVDVHNVASLQKTGAAVRKTIEGASFPEDLKDAIGAAYEELVKKSGGTPDVAVRSSATAEDLPTASFAGQQETFLNVRGKNEVIAAAKKAMASLFTNRAISYRADKGFSSGDVALSVGVQKMVRSDEATSGVLFTIDTETGFENVVTIDASYGLGEPLVKGKITPDAYIIFKPALKEGKSGIIAKELGTKEQKMIYGARGGKTVPVPEADRKRFALSDEEITQLSKWAVVIEEHFSKKYGRYQPMDIEWAKDGPGGGLYVVQARPETVHATMEKNVIREYHLKESGDKLASGTAVGTKIAAGPVNIIKNVKKIRDFKKGEVLVTTMTDPDWEPIMKIAAAIVTDKGGRTSHAAIVSRELGIPAIVGSGNATAALAKEKQVTVDCSSGAVGTVYRGALPFDVEEIHLEKLPETKTRVMVNVGSPHEAFKNHALPVKGVGLGRVEFIISGAIRVHPNALIDYTEIAKGKTPDDRKLAATIDAYTHGWSDKRQFYVDKLAEGIGKIGAAFWPNEVIIRFSDFKTNEYRSLVGGDRYEPVEANPMIGWRGASRYYDERFKEAFGLECKAVKKARDEMGLSNVVVMVPFCRTVDEGKKVVRTMEEYGLSRRVDKKLKVYVMCEIPSNVVDAESFLEVFDGMSIGSNDLTQLVLGIDRDSEKLADVGNENDYAVRKMIADVIARAKAKKKYIGICGQAPSDFPEFAAFLVENGIDSISLIPDTVLKTLPVIAEHEKKRAPKISKNV